MKNTLRFFLLPLLVAAPMTAFAHQPLTVKLYYQGAGETFQAQAMSSGPGGASIDLGTSPSTGPDSSGNYTFHLEIDESKVKNNTISLAVFSKPAHIDEACASQAGNQNIPFYDKHVIALSSVQLTLDLVSGTDLMCHWEDLKY
jgi:hypothetical protein